ncbi:20491_t:CDS:1, partial [Gigaspora margarita]
NLKIKDILYSCLTVNRQWSFEAFRVILKQKKREFREDLDFIKNRLACSEQEITRIHIVLYTPRYNWITVGEEIANIHAIIKSHIYNLTRILSCLIKSSVLRNKFHVQWQNLYKQTKKMLKDIDLLDDINNT